MSICNGKIHSLLTAHCTFDACPCARRNLSLDSSNSMTDEGAQQPLSLMSFNDDILAAILKRLGSVYVIGRAYSLETEPAGSLRIAACVNRRLRRIVHTAVTETCALIDPSALEICISCPRMASTLFQHCDEVRIVPDAASALPKHPTFVSVALNSFTSLKRIHVTGAELSANLAQALACSQCAP